MPEPRIKGRDEPGVFDHDVETLGSFKSYGRGINQFGGPATFQQWLEIPHRSQDPTGWSTRHKGRTWFDSTNDIFKFWDGTQILSLVAMAPGVVTLTEHAIPFGSPDGYIDEDPTKLSWNKTTSTLAVSGTLNLTGPLNVVGSVSLDGSVIVNESGADKDFRIESDGKTHMFFVDAGNNRIGINEGAPVCLLHATLAICASYAGVGPDTVLLLENDDNVALQLQAAATGSAYLNFCDDAYNPPAGRVAYDFANDQLEFVIATNERVWFTTTQILTSLSSIEVDGLTTAAFIVDSHDSDAWIELQEDNSLQWTAGFDYSDSKAYVICKGSIGTNVRFRIDPTTGLISGSCVTPTLANHIANKDYIDTLIAAISDKKVAVDDAATPDYLGALSSDGALRTSSPLTYTDGGNYVTLGLNQALIDHGSIGGLGDDDHTQYYNTTRHTKAVHDALDIDADTLDNQHGSWYQNASNLNAGTVAYQRMNQYQAYYILDPRLPATNQVHSTLSDPTIAEQSIPDSPYIGNKLIFIVPISAQYTTNGEDWYDTSYTETQLKQWVMGRFSGSYLAIPSPNEGEWEAVRFVFQAPSYVFLNWLYTYIATQGHQLSIKIEKSYGSETDNYSQVALTNNFSSWPGHQSVPHTNIPWNPSPTPGTHSKYVRVTFYTTYNGSYPANNIRLYNLNWYGYYPANPQNDVWYWDENKDFWLKENLRLLTGKKLYLGSYYLDTLLANNKVDDADKVDGEHASAIVTKARVDAVAADHGALSGKGDDDHTQYTLASGARAFTGVVSGVDPTASTHLATKNYVDTQVSGISDKKVAVDSAATADYLGATSGDGALRTSSPLTYTDGGNYVTLGLNVGSIDHGALSGLGDDDHPQYLRSDAADTFTGQLTVGAGGSLKSGGAMVLIYASEGEVVLEQMNATGAIRLGGDDAMILGCGESSGTIKSNVSLTAEHTHIGSDNDVILYANLQDGWASRKEFRFDGDSHAYLPGRIYFGGVSDCYIYHDDALEALRYYNPYGYVSMYAGTGVGANVFWFDTDQSLGFGFVASISVNGYVYDAGAAIKFGAAKVQWASGTYVGETGGYVLVETSYGTTWFGMGNSAWTHFYTDASNGFYFDKRLDAVNRLGVYGADVYMDSGGVKLGGTTYYLGAGAVASKLYTLYITRIYSALGSVGAPAYTFDGDLDTGMYSSAANVICFATAGVVRLSMSASGVTVNAPLTTVDHGTPAQDEVVNVCYGTGSPPTASSTTIGALYIKYTA